MARAAQPVKISDIEFDALIESSESWTAETPQFPTETGFSVSDSIILKPVTLSMTLFLSNTPVTWRERFGSNPSRVQDVIKRLEEIYFSKEPVTISTSEKTYSNMAIVSIELAKTKETRQSREIPISFQQVIVTESRITTIPDSYGKGGQSGANAGMANTRQNNTPSGTESTGDDASIIHGIKYGNANRSGLFGGRK